MTAGKDAGRYAVEQPQVFHHPAKPGAQRLTLIRQAAKRNVLVGARLGERLGLSIKDG